MFADPACFHVEDKQRMRRVTVLPTLLQFYVAKSVSCSIHAILVILREIMQKLSNFSFKIKENWENCHSEI